MNRRPFSLRSLAAVDSAAVMSHRPYVSASTANLKQSQLNPLVAIFLMHSLNGNLEVFFQSKIHYFLFRFQSSDGKFYEVELKLLLIPLQFRGGRSQFGRGYSGRPVGPATGDRPEFVSGDSHFGAVRDANRGFRPSYNAVPPPPQLYNTQPLHRPGPRFQRPGPPVVQAEQHPGPRPFMRPPQRPGLGSTSGNYQQFSPRPMQQQFRPRATKPPDYREWEYRKMELPPHCGNSSC